MKDRGLCTGSFRVMTRRPAELLDCARQELLPCGNVITLCAAEVIEAKHPVTSQ